MGELKVAGVDKRGGSRIVHVAKMARLVPVSMTLLVVMWVLQVGRLQQSVGLPWVDYWSSVGDTARRVAMSGLTGEHGAATMVATAALLVFAIPAEHILGSRVFAAAMAVLHVVGVLVGFVCIGGVMRLDDWWGDVLIAQTFLSPTPWIFGVTAFASASMPVLWRRRTRLVLLVVAATLLLYDGVIVDFVRLSAFLIGVVWGEARVRGWSGIAHDFRLHRPSLREGRVLVAIVVVAVAAGPFLASVNPYSAGPLSEIAVVAWQAHAANTLGHTSVVVRFAGQIPLLVVGIIAVGLAWGRRLAWGAALCMQLVVVVALMWEMEHLIRHYGDDADRAADVLSVISPWLVTFVVLLFTRRFFQVSVGAKEVMRLVRRVVLAVAGGAVVWCGSGGLLQSGFHGHPTLRDFAEDYPLRLLPPVLSEVMNPQVVPEKWFAWVLTDWVGVVVGVVVCGALAGAMVAVPNPVAVADRHRARALLQQGTGGHLSWMTLWPGNRYWFDTVPDTDGELARGFVAFRVHAGVAVTVGEPVVVPGIDPQDVADRFERAATTAGWSTAWYSVGHVFSDGRVERGWNQLQVAEESVLDTSGEVQFKGKRFQDIRTARNRAAKEGIHTELITWETASPVTRERIIALSEEWVSEKSLPEMGFTLGGVEQLNDPDVLLMLALDEEGHVHGVTSWLPVYRDGVAVGYILDFMRRDPAGFRPVIEFLIAETMLMAANRNVEWISLSGAPLAHSSGTSEAEDSDSFLSTALDRVGLALEPLYGFRSLAAFKHKFYPEYQSWFLCYRDELSLPAIGVALGRCYVPQLHVTSMVDIAREWRANNR